MPRIRLAFWHGSHQPGDELDVTDDELRELRRDGRVAEVLGAPAQPAPKAPPEPATETAASVEGRGRKAR